MIILLPALFILCLFYLVLRRNGSGLGRFLAFIILASIFWSGYSRYSDRKAGLEPASASASTTTLPDPKKVALSTTSISKWSWHTDGFGTVMKATFTIKNDGDEAVKDIEVKCLHAAPSGTVIDSNTRTIYEIIPAHKSRTFRDFDMGFIHSQASKSNCEIEDLALLH